MLQRAIDGGPNLQVRSLRKTFARPKDRKRRRPRFRPSLSLYWLRSTSRYSASSPLSKASVRMSQPP